MPRQRGHASPEGLRSEKDAVSMVKHSENEKSATKTTKKHSKIVFSDFRCSFSLCFHSQHFRGTRILQSELSRDLFFFFLIPLSTKTPSFESISGRPSSKKTIKNMCFR